MKMREIMGYSDKSNQNPLSAPSCFVSSRKQLETYVGVLITLWLLPSTFCLYLQSHFAFTYSHLIPFPHCLVLQLPPPYLLCANFRLCTQVMLFLLVVSCQMSCHSKPTEQYLSQILASPCYPAPASADCSTISVRIHP